MKIDGTAARGFERVAEAFERNFGGRGLVVAAKCPEDGWRRIE